MTYAEMNRLIKMRETLETYEKYIDELMKREEKPDVKMVLNEVRINVGVATINLMELINY